MRLLTGAILLGAASLEAQAPVVRPPTVAAPWTDIAQRSPILGESRTLRVVLPPDYATSGRRYPALLLLDADDEPQFRAAISSVGFLASRDAIPPMIIVGLRNGANRTRDLTPDSLHPAFLGERGGGGNRFLDYVEKEVLPTIRARYRTAPFTVFAGHSLGGLIGVHAAGTRPQLAHAIIAMSPSLWVNNEAGTPRFVRDIAGRPTPLHLYTTRGRYEPGIDSSVARFEEQLSAAIASRRDGSIRYGHARYGVDSHGLTPITSLQDGLRYVFADYSRAVTGFDSLPEPSTIDSVSLLRAARETDALHIRARRASPATLIGGDTAAPDAPSIGEYLNTVPFFMLLKQYGAALEYFGHARSVYPNSPQLRQVLGDVLVARGDTAQAIREYDSALALAASPTHLALRRMVLARLRPLRAATPDGRRAAPASARSKRAADGR